MAGESNPEGAVQGAPTEAGDRCNACGWKFSDHKEIDGPERATTCPGDPPEFLNRFIEGEGGEKKEGGAADLGGAVDAMLSAYEKWGGDEWDSEFYKLLDAVGEVRRLRSLPFSEGPADPTLREELRAIYRRIEKDETLVETAHHLGKALMYLDIGAAPHQGQEGAP